MSEIKFSRNNLIKKVKEAQEQLAEAKAKRKALEDTWKSLQVEKQETLEKAKELAAITERINKREPELQQEMTDLIVSTNKVEGFLESISSLIEGSLEDLVKELE